MSETPWMLPGAFEMQVNRDMTNAYKPPEKVSMDQKLAAAKEWLGDRYVYAHPEGKRRR